jgi:hypothetical protein
MQRIRLLLILALFAFITAVTSTAFAQKKLSTDDKLLQDSIYKSNKKKVLNFSMKEFDTLFFDYFEKKNDTKLLMTKVQFYNYTVQIATFSDRLAALYPEQKQVAEENKERWLSESYEDYLEYKASQKK